MTASFAAISQDLTSIFQVAVVFSPLMKGSVAGVLGTDCQTEALTVRERCSIWPHVTLVRYNPKMFLNGFEQSQLLATYIGQTFLVGGLNGRPWR